MIKINIKLPKRLIIFLPIIAVGSFLLIPASVAGIVLSAHIPFMPSTSQAPQPTPDAPVAVLPAPKKAPEQSIPALSTATAPSIVIKIKPQPVVTTAPSSSVSSLKPTSTSSTTPSTSTSPSPSSPQTTTVTSGYTSTNWSGYMATSGSFSAVSGSWTVPHVTGNGSTTSGDAAWIGIGGVTSSDLIQVGTADSVSASGQVSVSFFYEMLPATAQFISTTTINQGDTIHASLSGNNGVWTITITDVTTNQSFTTTVSYTSSLSSAEWIEEDPSYSGGQLMPLDNFGTVPFSVSYATIGGVSTSLAGAKAEPITLVDGSGHVIAAPSTITSDGLGFSVTHS